MSKLKRLGKHIWIRHAERETDRPILAAIAGSRRTLLMDAGNSPAHAARFREELAGQGVKQPDLLVLTHWHWDHSFGMSSWNIPSIAHAESGHALQKLIGLDWTDETLDSLVRENVISESTVAHIKLEYGDNRRIQVVEPDVLFEDRLTIDLGGVTVEIQHAGGDHSEDCCFVYVREDKTLFLGDAFGPAVYGGPRHYTCSGFLRLVELAFKYDADMYVESHDKPVGKEAFHQDIRDWVYLARLIERYGGNRDKVVREMTAYMNVPRLSGDLEKGVDLFLAGEERLGRKIE